MTSTHLQDNHTVWLSGMSKERVHLTKEYCKVAAPLMKVDALLQLQKEIKRSC